MMKLSFLLSSLYLVCVKGGLRSSTQNNLAVTDPNEVVYDDASSHRHELETNYHREMYDENVHGLLHSRILASDPLLPGISVTTRSNCSNNRRGVRIGEGAVYDLTWR